MTDSMRDRIARVLGVGEVHHPDQCDCSWDSWGEVDAPCTGLDAQVDAILAAFPWLADEPRDAEVDAGARGGEPTEEEIEAGAREAWRYYVGSNLDGFDKHAYAYDREKAHDTARAVLRAAREARTT